MYVLILVIIYDWLLRMIYIATVKVYMMFGQGK